MAEIVQLPSRTVHGSRQASNRGGSAQILMFTGVRYESPPEDDEESSTNGQNAGKAMSTPQERGSA